MDKDVQKILDLAERMKEVFGRLEARQTFTDGQIRAVRSAANMQRFFEGSALAEMRAEFDPDYAKEMRRLTRMAKG